MWVQWRNKNHRYFNPHSHAGSDFSAPDIVAPLFDFNPHSHAGSDNVHSFFIRGIKYFNPHSHAGSDGSYLMGYLVMMYFNPHSHAGSDTIYNEIARGTVISIHTPTQGVTKLYYCHPYRSSISIHTPTQGVTMVSVFCVRKSKFQSTLPRRE